MFTGVPLKLWAGFIVNSLVNDCTRLDAPPERLTAGLPSSFSDASLARALWRVPILNLFCRPPVFMSQWGGNGRRQVISDGLMVMTVPSRAEWMGLIEQSVFKCVRTCVCVHLGVGGVWGGWGGFSKWQRFPWQQLNAGRFQVKVN